MSETKKKIEGKNKRTPCMPVVKFGACVYPRAHPETKQRKKKVPSWELFNLQCNEWNRRKRGWGELRLNERFEMKRDGEFFIQKTKANKYKRKYFISLLLMKFTSRNSKSHPCNYFSMQWMKQKYSERGEMRLTES